MLVLSRRKDEVIRIKIDPSMIRDECFIDVMVVQTASDFSRLGISAPRNIEIHRLEVWEMIETKAIEAELENT